MNVANDNLENELIHLIKNIIEIDELSFTDDLFEIGFNSLKLIELEYNLAENYGVEIDLEKLILSTTIEDITNLIRTAIETKDDAIVHEKDKFLVDNKDPEILETSAAQKRMYILSLFDTTGVKYNITFAKIIEGELNIDKVQEIILALVQRHEAFRTSFFINSNGEIAQKVHSEINYSFSYEEIKEEDANQAVVNFKRRFDLAEPPLMRTLILKISNSNKYILVNDTHHIISDDLSNEIFLKEFIKLYAEGNLDAVDACYKDYVLWQKELLSSSKGVEMENYWMSKYIQGIPSLNIKTDYNLEGRTDERGNFLHFTLEKNDYFQISNIFRDNRISMYMGLLAILGIEMSKYSEQENILVGAVVSGRTTKRFENVIGMFINTVVMRLNPKANLDFLSYVSNIKEEVAKTLQNQAYPFEEILDKISVNRDINTNPIYNVSFTYHKQVVDFNLPKSFIKDFYIKEHVPAPKVYFAFEVSEVKDNINFVIFYNEGLFSKSRIEKIAKDYNEIIKYIIKNPTILIKDICI